MFKGPVRGIASQIAVFIVEGGTCGGCALESRAAMASPYTALRRGIVPVETPAHADVLLVCGVEPLPLAEEIRQLAGTLSEPWVCLRLGDCAAGAESILGREVAVPGCPPSPEEILAAVKAVWQDRHEWVGHPGAPEERSHDREDHV